MIKATELRIGNSVDHGEIVRVIGFDSYQDRVSLSSSINTSPRSLEPIPITKERLLKFGFEWSVCGSCLNYNGISVYIGIESKSYREWKVDFWSEEEDEEWLTVNGFYYYIHQLQNLYFALTGEELKEK